MIDATVDRRATRGAAAGPNLGSSRRHQKVRSRPMPKGVPVAIERGPLRELEALFEGEWLLIKILDNRGHPGDRPAELLAHSPNWNKLSRIGLKVHQYDPTALITIVQSGLHWVDGETFRRGLARIAA